MKILSIGLASQLAKFYALQILFAEEQMILANLHPENALTLLRKVENNAALYNCEKGICKLSASLGFNVSQDSYLESQVGQSVYLRPLTPKVSSILHCLTWTIPSTSDECRQSIADWIASFEIRHDVLADFVAFGGYDGFEDYMTESEKLNAE